jgi:hypothetical protein
LAGTAVAGVAAEEAVEVAVEVAVGFLLAVGFPVVEAFLVEEFRVEAFLVEEFRVEAILREILL